MDMFGRNKNKGPKGTSPGREDRDSSADMKDERESSMTEKLTGLLKTKSKSRSPEKRDVDGADDKKDERESSMSGKVTGFIKPYLKEAQTWTAKEASDAKKDLQRYAGLGHRPDAVPRGESFVNGESRTVELGWHPVAGATGKWFAEKTMIGNKITQKVGKYPDPTQHWAVIVGDYVHELWMDGDLAIIYINEAFKRDEWHTFKVGATRFNDQALSKAGRMTIHNMRAKKAAYNLISNNCQNFAVEMLKAIQVGGHRDFGTTFAVYQRATGEGAIMDLFADKPDHDPAQLQQDEVDVTAPQRQDTVAHAQQLMDENTTTLDHDGDGRPG